MENEKEDLHDGIKHVAVNICKVYKDGKVDPTQLEMQVFAYSKDYGIESLVIHERTETHSFFDNKAFDVKNCMATLKMVKGGGRKKIIEPGVGYDVGSRKFDSSIAIIHADDKELLKHHPRHRIIDPIGGG